MFLMLSLLLAAVPTAADVQTVEEWRILEPMADQTRDGSLFVEFAPTIETRNASCVVVGDVTAECTYESRVRDFLSSEFGLWEARRERLVWQENCWKMASKR